MEQTRLVFAALVAPGAGRIDGELDVGALLLAQAVDRSVDIEEQLARLDQIAADCSPTTVGRLAVDLFGGLAVDPSRHFVGNETAYYDADNSLLHRVLDRRIGIPISLSVLLVEVGRRCGLSLHGVGMPGHFLVGSADGFIDPFHGGVFLDAAGCERVFQGIAGADAVLPAGALAPTPPAMILKRMLFNLATIGANQQQRGMLRAVRSLLAVFPEADHRDHVQHAYAAAEIGQFDEAAAAGELALETIPDQVHDKLETQIAGWRARLN